MKMKPNFPIFLILSIFLISVSFVLLSNLAIADHNSKGKSGSCTANLCGKDNIPAAGGCYCDAWSITDGHDNCNNIQTACSELWNKVKGAGTTTGQTAQTKPLGAGCVYSSSFYGDDGTCDAPADQCNPGWSKYPPDASCNECSITHTNPEFTQWQQEYCKSAPTGATAPTGNKPNLVGAISAFPKNAIIQLGKPSVNVIINLTISNDGADFVIPTPFKLFEYTDKADADVSDLVVVQSGIVSVNGKEVWKSGGSIAKTDLLTFKTSGSKTIAVKIDPNNAVDESPESDNVVQTTVFVQTASSPCGLVGNDFICL